VKWRRTVGEEYPESDSSYSRSGSEDEEGIDGSYGRSQVCIHKPIDGEWQYGKMNSKGNGSYLRLQRQ